MPRFTNSVAKSSGFRGVFTGNCDNNGESISGIDASPPRKLMSIDNYLDSLSQKRDSKRMEALTGIIEILSTTMKTEFVQKKFATLLYGFHHCIKKGSSKEINLAANAIGLLAMTNDSQSNGQEIYAESIPVLTEALKLKSKTSMVLHCLAVVTFFSANNSDETEGTMQVIWSFIQSEFGSDLANSKHPTLLLNDAICSWSFLLASLDGWRLSYKYWQGAISYLLDLLQQSDESVCVAAGEALALIFESRNIDKFVTQEDSSCDTPINGVINSPEKFSVLKEKLTDEVLKQLEKLPDNPDWDVLKYFKDGSYPQFRTKISGDFINLSSWSQKIQLNFLKQFLGQAGFVKHMRENELVQNVFEFKPRKIDYSRKDIYTSTHEKVIIRCYLPSTRDSSNLTRTEIKHDRNRTLNAISKAQTQLRNKHRTLAEMRGNDSNTFGC